MAGRFMDKETLEQEAARLGVDLTGLKWPQKQKAVMNAQSKEKGEEPVEDLPMKDLTVDEIKSILFNEDVDDPFVPVIPTKEQGQEIYIHVENPQDPMEQMRGKKVLIAPEMAKTARQLFGYEEDLGEEITVEEVVHDVDSAYKAGLDTVTGTYHVTGKTGKRVKGHTALPKQGAGITFRPDRDRVPVVTFEGRSGYLWTHHRLPNIKQLLLESGYYEEYKGRFKDQPFVWHAAGKLLCCDIQLAESILVEIERKERTRRIRKVQDDAFLRSQLGE